MLDTAQQYGVLSKLFGCLVFDLTVRSALHDFEHLELGLHSWRRGDEGPSLTPSSAIHRCASFLTHPLRILTRRTVRRPSWSEADRTQERPTTRADHLWRRSTHARVRYFTSQTAARIDQRAE